MTTNWKGTYIMVNVALAVSLDTTLITVIVKRR
jgi:hypothetical protein